MNWQPQRVSLINRAPAEMKSRVIGGFKFVSSCWREIGMMLARTVLLAMVAPTASLVVVPGFPTVQSRVVRAHCAPAMLAGKAEVSAALSMPRERRVAESGCAHAGDEDEGPAGEVGR